MPKKGKKAKKGKKGEKPSPCNTSCWICLCDGPDESGSPPRRDCSCRGSSGYAHLSCTIEYATTKSLEIGIETTASKFTHPWTHCPNCHQRYTGELSVDLGAAIVTFADERFSSNPFIRAECLLIKAASISNLGNCNTQQIKEGKNICFEGISTVEKAERESGMSTKRSKVMRACFYDIIALFSKFEKSEEGYKTALIYTKKSREILISNGYSVEARNAEMKINEIKTMINPFGRVIQKDEIAIAESCYKECCKSLGETALQSIHTGTRLTKVYQKEHQQIKAQRLLTKLLKMCQQVHGTEHEITERVESSLKVCKQRKISILQTDGENHSYECLGNGAKEGTYNAQGPINLVGARNVKNELGVIFNATDIILLPGTPVMCHGLKSASHLNGNIGDVRSIDYEQGRFAVYFEDSKLKSCWVKPGNLKILFEIPDFK